MNDPADRIDDALPSAAIRRKRMRRVRVLLVLVSLFLLMAILIPAMDSNVVKNNALLSAEMTLVNLSPSLINLHLNGYDDEGRPYSIGAASARQIIGTETIRLSGLRAKWQKSEDHWVRAEADNGLLDRGLSELAISSKITLHSSLGYAVRGKESLVNFSEGTIESDAALEGEGPLGRFDAQGLRMKFSGEILLKGPVHMTIHLPEPEAAQMARAKEGGTP